MGRHFAISVKCAASANMLISQGLTSAPEKWGGGGVRGVGKFEIDFSLHEI